MGYELITMKHHQTLLRARAASQCARCTFPCTRNLTDFSPVPLPWGLSQPQGPPVATQKGVAPKARMDRTGSMKTGERGRLELGVGTAPASHWPRLRKQQVRLAPERLHWAVARTRDA